MSAWSTHMSLIRQRSGGACEADLSPACQRTATHLHGRVPGSTVRPATHLWVCARCNVWIGNHHTRAKMLGWHLDNPADAETVPLLRHGVTVHLGHDGTMWPAQAVTA